MAGLAYVPTQCSGSAPQQQLLLFAVLIAALLEWNLNIVSLFISSVDNVLVLFLVSEIRDIDDSNLGELGLTWLFVPGYSPSLTGKSRDRELEASGLEQRPVDGCF